MLLLPYESEPKPSKSCDGFTDSNLIKPWIAIDCGICGTLNREDKRYLAENFVAFFNRDYRKVAELHVD
ncbi:hypothetical protein H4J42_14815, partial [Colwellia sp. BRX8-8]|nr:hypothetical protein [Colwellia sp. BRX8-8]